MSKTNLLLGYGESLVRDIDTPGRDGDKKHPYSYAEAKAAFLEQSGRLLTEISNIPDDALPSGRAVAKLILHPAYLAKSYYPESMLRTFDLNCIGSKSVLVSPKKQTQKKPKDILVTPCMYVSGTSNSFESLRNHVESDDLTKGIQMEIRQIEDLDLFSATEKIKSLGEQGEEGKYEIVMHSPLAEPSVLESLMEYSDKCGAKLDLERTIMSGGLTFIPAITTPENAMELAKFTYLRALRVMPEIRSNKPIVTRTVLTSEAPSLPNEDAVDPNINVAIFDGGIGSNVVDRWCNETIYPGGERTDPKLLTHGGDVTSTVLFGIVDEQTNEIQAPYSNVDHFRVLDPVSGQDPDLFDVLIRIKNALEAKKYDFVNLSLGPQLPVEDEDVHVWTSTLDPLLGSMNTLAAVAVGNDGNLPDQNRIQPPSDMVNALAVGASNSRNANWSRADYSCVGPGRSPGLVKPDGLSFGGVTGELFKVLSLQNGQIVGTAGTSFATPLTLRNAIALKASLDHEITPLTSKALLVHSTSKPSAKLPQSEIGWGHFPEDIGEIVYCDDNEATILYQGYLSPSQYMRAPIPFPDIDLQGKIHISATFCYATEVDPEHPINYTRSGLTITFRPKQEETDTQPFFTLKQLFETEQEARSDAHKWETTLHRQKSFQRGTLKDPCFDIVYQAREQGHAVDLSSLEDLPYVLVVTVKCRNDQKIYDAIRQKYQVLQPIQLRQEVRVKATK